MTLQIDVYDMPDVHLDAVASALTRSEWSDGRYPFYQEMLQVGLKDDVQVAIRRVVQEQMMAKHGREMVPVGHGSHQARWAIETDNAMQGVHVSTVDHIREARIEVAE